MRGEKLWCIFMLQMFWYKSSEIEEYCNLQSLPALIFIERKESDEKELWFNQYGTADHGIVMGSERANVIQGYYGCCHNRVEKVMEGADIKYIFAWFAKNGIGWDW